MLDEARSTPTAPPRRSTDFTLLGTRLAASPFLSSEERYVLEKSALPAKSIAINKDLLRQAEHVSHIEILIEGWACRYKITRDGRRQIVGLLIPGDVANIDSFMFTRPAYAVRTLCTTKTISIPRDDLSNLAEQHSGIAKTLAWLAMRENAILSEWILCLGRLSAKQRVAHLVCELGLRLSGLNETESCFELPLTQEQIADILGLTAVHVNRMIRQLRGEGLIDVKGRIIRISNMTALCRVAEFDADYLYDRID